MSFETLVFLSSVTTSSNVYTVPSGRTGKNSAGTAGIKGPDFVDRWQWSKAASTQLRFRIAFAGRAGLAS